MLLYFNLYKLLFCGFIFRKLKTSEHDKKTPVDFLIFLIATSQYLPSLMSLSFIVMNQDPLYYLLGSEGASLIFMKILRFIFVAISDNFEDIYLNLMLIVLVLHISQLVECGVALLQWSKLQSKKVFSRQEYMQNVALLTFQLKLSCNVYVKMLLISNFMDETYFYIMPVLLSIGGCILITCNFACIRMSGTVDFILSFSFAGISCSILFLIVVLLPLADSVYENCVAFKLQMMSLTRRHTLFSRKVRSLRPCRVGFGPLFFAKKSTKCSYIDICFQNTANALLLYY